MCSPRTQGPSGSMNPLGYKEVAREPAVGHDKIRYGGDVLLMTRDL